MRMRAMTARRRRRVTQVPSFRSGDNTGTALPRKKNFRQRAHCNPLADSQFDAPAHPGDVDWRAHFPEFFAKRADAGDEEARKVRFADIGCGFGGLLVRLSPLFPDKLALGMEIRDKVTEYVRERCVALRAEHAATGGYENISCVRANTMKNLPQYFEKGQLEKVFFLFPDPHFKVGNHRRRIIQTTLLAEYAYVMREGGILYTITDVEELGQWMAKHLDEHPMFERVCEGDLAADPVIPLLYTGTEEGQKVERNAGSTYLNVFRRVANPFA